MSVVENFSRMASHMVNGMMVHEQLMNAYLFLGLKGYAECHKYHYLEETKSYISLCEYSVEHFDQIVTARINPEGIPEIIPMSWKQNNKYNIVVKTRIQAVEAALEEWISWEEKTKALYESIYHEIINEDVSASEFVKSYILDVEEEIVYSKNELLVKRAMEFDMSSILEEQEKYERSFKKKIRKG